MSGAKHTPGPWESQLSEQYPYDYAILADGREITRVDDLWDAYLIAAAPLLLEALEKVERAMGLNRQLESRMSYPHHATLDPMTVLRANSDARDAMMSALAAACGAEVQP